MSYKYSKYEMETTILFNEEEKTADIFTCSKSWQRKLDKLVQQFPDLFQLETEDIAHNSKTYRVPKKYISVRGPKVMTEEQLAKLKEVRLKTQFTKE